MLTLSFFRSVRNHPRSADTLWFSDNPKIGLAVRARPPYQFQALPSLPDTPKYVIPVSVTGPVSFTLFAVWSIQGQEHPYVRAICKAVDLYSHLIRDNPAVVVGDFNSNAIWDKDHPPEMNHSALVDRLASLGLVSAYHHVRNEPHGAEKEPSYYHQWNQQKPFHIDYCFVPRPWAEKITAVKIGSFEEWRRHSDHRPLLVDLPDDDRTASVRIGSV